MTIHQILKSIRKEDEDLPIVVTGMPCGGLERMNDRVRLLSCQGEAITIGKIKKLISRLPGDYPVYFGDRPIVAIERVGFDPEAYIRIAVSTSDHRDS